MSSKTYAGLNIQNGIKLEMFTKDDLDRLNLATMDILSTTGVWIADLKAVALYKNAGCDVDEKQVVRIPEYLVRESINRCPRRILLGAREKKYDYVMEAGRKTGSTTFGTGLYNYSHETKQIKESTNEDILNSAIVADWCKNIDFFSLTVAARDLLKQNLASDLHETLTSWSGTTKHFHHIDPLAEHMDLYYKMGVALNGGDEEAFRKRPPISVLLCPTSPLQIHMNGCGVIMKGAELGMPVNVLSMAMSGATGPVTLAGTLVTHNAEVLSGIVLAQLTRPGAPVMYGSSTTMFDLRSATAPVGAPELGLISAAVAKLAQYYNLPSYVAGS
jgi:trimethylamine--corrinoid protein Co-methyltransferase